MKSVNKIISAIIFCCVCSGISAQNIKFFFPQFVGKEYVFFLNAGLKKDTIQSGIIGENGFATVDIKIPEKYKNRTGIGSWSITNGPAISVVIINEDFSVTCEDSIPNPKNIIYKGNKENDLMNQYEIKLYALYHQLDSIFIANKITEKRESFSPSFLKAMKAANNDYLTIRKELVADTSYAAFFWRTINYIRGLGTRIYYHPDDAKDYFDDMTHYLTEELDPTLLYYSGLWNSVISPTFNIPDKVDWAENMLKMLKHTKSQFVFEAFSVDLIIICEQYNWQNAEKVILAYLESSDRLPADPNSIINRAILQGKVKIGDKAPALIGLDGIPTNALIIFYESGCTHCQHQLAEITQYYSQLQEKGIRVISVSTDESKEVFEYHSKYFPWSDRLCDLQGFKGENLINYGVIGTPTIYFIDGNGIVVDRQPRLEDIKALNLKLSPTP